MNLRRQKGQLIETATAFHVRFYVTQDDGSRAQKQVTLAKRSDVYRTAEDVRPLMERLMDSVNGEECPVTGRVTLSEFFESHYMPFIRETKAAATQAGYPKLFYKHLGPWFGKIALTDLTTQQVTQWLTRLAKNGLGARALSHCKWLLSGIYQHAIATGVLPHNPVPDAKVLCKVERIKQQRVYTLPEVLQMIAILEPRDLRAAVAVALAYFAALRPAEIRGLKWEDWTGDELQVRRAVWRGIEGETKTPESAASVPVIEPLRSLLAKLHGDRSPSGYILQNSVGRSLDLETLATRRIVPALKAAGLSWKGFYPCRRGISSLVTDTSKNALNSTGLLRHSNPVTALSFYTRAQKDSIAAALKTVEEMATKPAETIQ